MAKDREPRLKLKQLKQEAKSQGIPLVRFLRERRKEKKGIKIGSELQRDITNTSQVDQGTPAYEKAKQDNKLATMNIMKDETTGEDMFVLKDTQQLDEVTVTPQLDPIFQPKSYEEAKDAVFMNAIEDAAMRSETTRVGSPELASITADMHLLREEAEIQDKPKTEVRKSDRKLVKEYKKTLIEEKNKNYEEIKSSLYKNYTSENMETVRALQQMLVDNGYRLPKYGVDGKYGNETDNAYRNYINDQVAEMQANKIPQYIQKSLAMQTSEKECTRDGCAYYVSDVLGNNVLGDAWEMKNNIAQGGGEIKYNIYDDASFLDVGSADEMRAKTKEIKKYNKANRSHFAVGDVVGMYNDGSDMHETAFKEGTGGTYNTHVGVVSEIRDGVPIISHNIHGKLHHQPYNQVTIGWVGTPDFQDIPTYKHISTAEENDAEGHINFYVPRMIEDFGGGVEQQQVLQDVYGILRLESNLGKLTPTEEDIQSSMEKKKLLGDAATRNNVSRGAAKIKLDTLTPNEKQLLNIRDNNIDELEPSVRAATYLYLKHHKLFTEYAKANPDIGLTEDDVRTMTILAHNQGTKKLLNFGYNQNGLTMDEELKLLRSLKQGTISDVTSTKFRYGYRFGWLGKMAADVAYEVKYGGEHETYVGRVLKHGQTFLPDSP